MLLYLCHALLTPATFPLEESFSPPAGIRPSVGWTSRNASRICNVTARLSSRFFSLLFSLFLRLFLLRGNKFSRASPWETWKHRARRNISRREIVPRHFPPKISYSFHKDDTMIPWNFRSTIYSPSYHRVRIVYRLLQSQVEMRGEHSHNFSSRTNPQNRSFKGWSCTRDTRNKEKYRNFFTSNLQRSIERFTESDSRNSISIFNNSPRSSSRFLHPFDQRAFHSFFLSLVEIETDSTNLRHSF